MNILLKQLTLIFTLLTLYTFSTAQENIIKGRVTDIKGNGIPMVQIAKLNSTIGCISDDDGYFNLELKKNRDTVVRIIVTYLGYKDEYRNVKLINGKYPFQRITLKEETYEIENVIVSAQKRDPSALRMVKLEGIGYSPISIGGVETLIKTLPGVSASNELSSQYTVRGGNYDENLIYINGIEVYKPFLIRSGQQEGLSVINPDLVKSVEFSAGGFNAGYGDKLSSVLAIKYKKPEEMQAGVSLGLLKSSVYVGGATPNKKLNVIAGARYKTTRFLLGTLDTKGEYKPNFVDGQLFADYKLSDKVSINLFGNFSSTEFNFKPKDRETTFGSLNQQQILKIYFEGQEEDKFQTSQVALGLNWRPVSNLNLRTFVSGFYTDESETYDILGQYWLHDMFTDENTSGANGVGSYLGHARNYMKAKVLEVKHKGTYSGVNSSLSWSLAYKLQDFDYQTKEWKMLDSAGYSVPYSDNKIELEYLVNSKQKRENNIFEAGLSYIHNFETTNGSEIKVNAGIRASYSSINNDYFISPRVSIAYLPIWNDNLQFTLSGGSYNQHPFFKEMVNRQGQWNSDVVSQKSWHLVLGNAYYFKWWGRPFKLNSELYYKYMYDLVPYKINNVQVIYEAQNSAKGYAYGAEIKLNGEFVEESESWVSLSIMQTKEDRENDYWFDENNQKVFIGYYHRPTDRLFNFSMFFQDYLPMLPTWKVNLTAFYGTGTPQSIPHSERNDNYFRLPDYKRVDVGFTKVFKQKDQVESSWKLLKNIDSFWVSAEVLNLLNIRNTISHIWIKSVSSQNGEQGYYAVPNYLTGRMFNIKVTAKF